MKWFYPHEILKRQEIERTDPDALALLANVYLKTEREDEARKSLEYAKYLNPESDMIKSLLEIFKKR